MRLSHGKIFARMVSLSILCLAVALGCGYLQPAVKDTPQVLVFPDDQTRTPGSSLIPSSSDSPIATQQPAEQTSSPHVTSTASAPARVPAQYTLDANFDFEAHSLAVNEQINYENLSPDRLTDLTLVVEPNLTPQGFTLVSLAWADGLAVNQYELTGNHLHIPLLQPLEPGSSLSLMINYRLDIPELADTSTLSRPVAYGYSDRQTNIVDWYPYIPPYLGGKGWLVHPDWGLGEYQVFDLADFTVTITLAKPVPQLTLAASAPATVQGDKYAYHLEAARTFALSASTVYLLQTTMVGDVKIYSYSFPYDKNAGQEVMYDTAQALQLYSRLILPYSRPTLSIVEADFLDGMEYEGLFFLSHGFYDLYDGTPQGYLTFIAAHETAHQWWYGLVGNDQALEPWLDEALCTYMELVFYENVYAGYPLGTGESLVNWWWYYRVNLYDPDGWVNSTIFEFTNNRPYRDAVYLNGVEFLQDLRNLIGDQAFFAFLRDYTAKYAHSIATTENFFSTLKDHTSQNLDSLISAYFRFSQ